MAEKKKTSVAKKDRSIPVKVSIDTRPTLTPLPPLTPETLKPQLPKQKSAPKLPHKRPAQSLNTPVHEWSEEKRRRLMWWLVGGGATIIIIGWLAVVRFEMSGGSGKNIFSEAWQLIRSVNIGGTPKSTAAEQEIRQLDKEVFPQFSK